MGHAEWQRNPPFVPSGHFPPMRGEEKGGSLTPPG
jgi:hypothetical protein